MGILTIRNLDDAVKAKLRIQAAEHGWAMEEEVRRILTRATLGTSGTSGTEDPLGSRIHARAIEGLVRISLAGNHRELWALRADAYNVIARGHCQSIAADRIHDMAHLFHGWVDRAELRSGAPVGQRAGAGR